MRPCVLLVAAACGSSSPAPVDEPRALGMNDVSMLLPLPADPARPVVATIAELVPRNLVASLVGANGIAPKTGAAVAYEDFHVVAIRFDLCERAGAGPCPDDDGRLRVVLQPVLVASDGMRAHDIALHAFYPIPAGELAMVVDELRTLSAIQGLPVHARLAVNSGVGSREYVARLRALLATYAGSDRLVKVTVIGQDAASAAFAWIFGGFELREGAFAPIPIPNLGGRTRQHLLVAGGDTVYHVQPGVDSPPGFAYALNGVRFGAATPDEQRFALETLAAIQNPLRHEASDTQCFGFGTEGTIFAMAPDNTSRKLTGLDPVRRRVGLAQDSGGKLYESYFVGSGMMMQTGGVSEITLVGDVATETEIAGGSTSAGFKKVVGVVATPTAVFVADQTQKTIFKIALPDKTVTPVAIVPSADLLAFMPNGDLLTGGTGVHRVTQAGVVSTLPLGPFESVRGLAFDPTLKRLFLIEHSATVGVADKLHVVPLDQ